MPSPPSTERSSTPPTKRLLSRPCSHAPPDFIPPDHSQPHPSYVYCDIFYFSSFPAAKHHPRHCRIDEVLAQVSQSALEDGYRRIHTCHRRRTSARMPYFKSSQEWLEQSTLLLEARPSTVRAIHRSTPSLYLRRSRFPRPTTRGTQALSDRELVS